MSCLAPTAVSRRPCPGGPLCRAQLLGLLLLGSLGACGGARYAADRSAEIVALAAPATASHFDYVLVGQALPAQILQLEGMRRASPHNRVLSHALVRAYYAYAYGWVDDAREAAEAVAPADTLESLDADDEVSKTDEVRVLRERAARLYARVSELALQALGQWRPAFPGVYASGASALRTWLSAAKLAPDTASLMLYLALAQLARADSTEGAAEDLAQLPRARVLLDRVLRFDPQLEAAAALTALAALDARLPEAAGGDAKRARSRFKRARELTQDRAHAVHLAEVDALLLPKGRTAQAREVLACILRGEEDAPEWRLSNRIAARRAQRRLKRLTAAAGEIAPETP